MRGIVALSESRRSELQTLGAYCECLQWQPPAARASRSSSVKKFAQSSELTPRPDRNLVGLYHSVIRAIICKFFHFNFFNIAEAGDEHT